MDLVGLLPKSNWGHKYVLVIMDYATKYPEVVPLWKATATLDDVIIHSSTWSEHLYHLQEVLGSLRKAGLMANPS